MELLRENSSVLVSTNHAKINKPGHEHEVYVLVTKELLNAKDHTTHKQTCARYEGRVFVSLQDHVEKKVGGGGGGEGTLGVKGMNSGLSIEIREVWSRIGYHLVSLIVPFQSEKQGASEAPSIKKLHDQTGFRSGT